MRKLCFRFFALALLVFSCCALETAWAEDSFNYSKGTYEVGAEFPEGTWLFKPLNGGSSSLIRVYDNNGRQVYALKAEEDGCVLNLRSEQTVKINKDVSVSAFCVSWEDEESKMLPVGVYYIGTDIPAGRFLFKQAEGVSGPDGVYIALLENINEQLDGGRTAGQGYSLYLPDGYLLVIPWSACITCRYEPEWADGKAVLKPGTYYAGKDITAGYYQFIQEEEFERDSDLQVFNADDLKKSVTAGFAGKYGCHLDLAEGQILKITFSEVKAVLIK